MSPAAEADPSSLKDSHNTQLEDHKPATSDPIHNDDSPAQTTMNEHDNHNTTETEKDDAATMAASEELKHTTISDKDSNTSTLEPRAPRLELATENKNMEEKVKESTPEHETTEAQDEELKEKLSSPKKKRGRDTYDESKELEGGNADEAGASADGVAVNGSRTEREGPEKKRHRDTSEDPSKVAEKSIEANETAPTDPITTTQTTTADVETSRKLSVSSPKPTFGSSYNDKPQTSASAFASSGFSTLTGSSTSPFGAIASSKPSVFGGNTQPTTSGFGALAGAKPPSSTSTITTTGSGGFSGDKPVSGFGFGGTSRSGFGALGSGSAFGSALGNGFAGGSGPKLSSFAAPGKDVPASKHIRAFGAPESDEEDASDDDGSDGGADLDEERDSPEEKKKSKVTKVHVEDGESGEATLLQLRAKLFALDSKEAGWKERGVGTLKVNVPKSCASFDENGIAVPGSFDASGLDEEEEEESTSRCMPRLIMRQENTHRVILNTIILRAMEFRDKPSSSAAQILFTAFEGEKNPKPINMLFKMSEANARHFRREIQSIQHEL